jgi:polar amino acid transport system permease protein
MSVVSGTAAANVERPPALRQGWPRERIFGWIFVAFWIAAGIGLFIYLYSAWDRELIDQWLPRYADGLLTTIILVVVSTILGAILSIPIAYARMGKNRFFGALAYGYVYFFRGTPLLAQTFLIYYGLGEFRVELEAVGLWGFFREAWSCAILAFALNTAAYQAEILRGAIESVPKGQWEGAASLGLHNLQTLQKVVLPQAMIVALRPYGNEIVLMIKGSAIVAIITVYDLMGITRFAYSRTFDFQAYIWAALVYLSMVELLRHTIEWIERRLTRHLLR